jgi:Mn-dependent DtxR family transcriptional regulator
MAENGFYTVRGYELLHSHSRMLTPAMEDYLEMMARHGEGLRTGALAQRLNVSASSATKMLSRLAALGLVAHRRYGAAELTDTGRELGAYLLLRHRTVEQFLRDIGIRENLLRETELMEHDISAETLARMEHLSRFLERSADVRDRLAAFSAERER